MLTGFLRRTLLIRDAAGVLMTGNRCLGPEIWKGGNTTETPAST